MAVTVTAPLDTPVVSGVTLAAGGSLVASTTYYFRVIAEDKNHMTPVQRLSAPSAEGTFTTDSTNKSVTITWGAITGATRYTIYLTTTSGVYNGARCYVATGSYYNGYTTASTTYTLDGSKTLQLAQHLFTSTKTDLFGMAKDVGKIQISFTGTTTLQNIYDAVVAAGYSSNIYWDGSTFALNGSINPTGTTTGSLTVTRVCFWFLHGGISNMNPNCTITFGTKTGYSPYYYGTYPCQFYFLSSYGQSVNGSSTGQINFYGCDFKAKTAYYAGEGFFQGVNPEIASATKVLMQDCRFNSITHSDYVGATGVTVVGATFGIRKNGAVINSPTVYGSYIDPYISMTTEPHIYNATIYRASTYDASGYEIRNLYANANAVPCNWHNLSCPGKTSNIPCVQWWWGVADKTYYKMWFTLDLKVQDFAGDPISGATVTIKDKNGVEVTGSPLTTDANGNITQIDLYAYRMDVDGAYGANYNSIITYQTPHTVTISKTGFRTRTIEYLMTKKKEEVEMLDVGSDTDSSILIEEIGDTYVQVA